MDQKIAEIAQHPLALFVTFHAVRQFVALLFHLQPDFIRDGLRLASVRTRANYEVVCEAGDACEIQNFDFGGFFILRGLYCNQPCRFGLLLSTSLNRSFGIRQKLAPIRYRTIEVSVYPRFTAFAAALLFLSLPAFSAQSETGVSDSPVAPQAAAIPSTNLLQPDENDPTVKLARETLDRITRLVQSGALPQMRLRKAQQDVEDALDASILKKNLYSNDILPEQAEQMIYVAQRMVVRRQSALLETQQLVSAGVISRAEAESSGVDLSNAQRELDWAETRAKLVEQMAASVKLQKEIASIESQAETHPEWNGKVYTRYDGTGVFTPSDLRVLETAYITRFSRPLPISANGETALHRSLGFDHRGRVDVAVTPDQPEGAWLMHYLQSKRIPYCAFRAAVPHQATGAHIHVGPGSTKLALSD